MNYKFSGTLILKLGTIFLAYCRAFPHLSLTIVGCSPQRREKQAARAYAAAHSNDAENLPQSLGWGSSDRTAVILHCCWNQDSTLWKGRLVNGCPGIRMRNCSPTQLSGNFHETKNIRINSVAKNDSRLQSIARLLNMDHLINQFPQNLYPSIG